MDSNADSPLATFAVSRSVAVEWAALGTAGFVVALFALGGLYATVTGQSEAGFSFSLSDTHGALVNLALALLLSGGVIVVHELVHGVVMSHYGGRPSYGAGWPTSSCRTPTPPVTPHFPATSSSSSRSPPWSSSPPSASRSCSPSRGPRCCCPSR
ncbi:DUF3267 domain-containing protein [Haladaptatus sp. GCM10025707]|uniref:DUF3267 domain-containing protein n=1 Tax=Haladaptatus sp. GCM10025707 TaxID=3252658 RepID=UPI0036221F9E